ncbi:MAG TPA: glycosyltransferase family 4 protein [Bacteroidia bacterium]|nr:glycosyltransferase family 4 protein [Bacteroidia bacterium]
MKEPGTIAFLTAADPSDKRAWSGIHWYVSRALEKHIGKVEFLGPYQPAFVYNSGRLASKVVRMLTGKNYDYSHSLRLAKAYGDHFNRKLREKNFSLIFSSAASSESAFIEKGLPMYYLADATAAALTGYYPYFSKLTRSSAKEILEVERRGISRAGHLIYASQWAADSAMNDFQAPPAKISVIPFGANIDEIPPADAVLSRKRGDTCRLLFLGAQWERKGGPIAFETLKELNRMGIKTELTVCGCVPPAKVSHPALRIIPFLDKRDPVQMQQFSAMMMATDFLLLPTRAECFGIVFCEASAYGVPSVSTLTGGVSGAIRENVNGILLPYEAAGKEYAMKIAESWSRENSYSELCVSSRKLFETELNWDAWALKVKSLMQRSGD